MRTTLPSPFAYTAARRVVGLFTLLLALVAFTTGCDSTGGLDDEAPEEATVSAEETAESIAFSLAEETGGTTDDLASGAALLGGGLSNSAGALAKAITRDRSCTYSDASQTWDCSLEVSGSNNRIDSLRFTRAYQIQFFSGDSPVRRPADADSMTLAIAAGNGAVKTERIDNAHELLPATWSMAKTATSGEFVARLLDGPSGRDVSETYTGPRRERTRTAEIRKTRVDDLVWRRGTPGRPISGTIEGTYTADVEILRPDSSTVTRTVDVAYVATFTEDGAEITFEGGGERFNGETFSFDVTTGSVE
jgi:hypothetical protein